MSALAKFYMNYMLPNYDKNEWRVISYFKELLWKIKDYDRLESDYSKMLMYATNGNMSKTNYSTWAVEAEIECAIQYHCDEREKELVEGLSNVIAETEHINNCIAYKRELGLYRKIDTLINNLHAIKNDLDIRR